jgi:hypothetical protein
MQMSRQEKVNSVYQQLPWLAFGSAQENLGSFAHEPLLFVAFAHTMQHRAFDLVVERPRKRILSEAMFSLSRRRH